MKLKKIAINIYYKMVNTHNSIIRLSKKKPLVKSSEETIYKIINDNCSVSRYGDGELGLIYGNKIGFQEYDERLSIRLKEILKSNQKNHIVCIPDVFNSLDRFEDKAKIFWEEYLSFYRNRIYKIIDMNKIYYDTQVTRLYMDYKDKSNIEYKFNKFKKVWDGRDLLIVEGNKSRIGIGNDLFNNSKSIKRIICPSENAFRKYDKILQEVLKHNKSKLVLIALGPTATILAYDLSIKGYQAIDIGHIDIEYEWFLLKATEKCSIKNKYVNECKNNDIEDIYNEEYVNQIIKQIS